MYTPTQTLRLTPRLRVKLKQPLGVLIKGTPKETMKKLRILINEENFTYLISVGDVVSNNMSKQGIRPQVIIVDNKIMRKKISPIKVTTDNTLYVKNPSGTLTPEAWRIIRSSFDNKGTTRVLVDGEEDLLTLVAVLQAPERAMVIYGQPYEGIVVVKVTPKMRDRIHQIIEEMEPASKS